MTATPMTSTRVRAVLLGALLACGTLPPAFAIDVEATAIDAAGCQAPASRDDGWQVASPVDAGFDATALCSVLDDVALSGTRVHGIVIERRGRLVAELYRTAPDRPITTLWGLFNPVPGATRFTPDTPHDVRSVSKSLIGLLVGALQQQGTAVDIHRPVLEFFPELADLRDPQRDTLTLAHLLTMTSGLDWEEGAFPNDEHRMFWRADRARLVLSRAMLDAPGTTWRYNGGGTFLVAEAMSRIGGRPFPELLQTLLFDPMGITAVEWATDLRGRPMPFTGARMRPRDMAKVGRLVLNRGQWQGRQLVASDWIDASLAPQVPTPARLPTGEPVHYGHQWRVGTLTSRGRVLTWAGAFGNGGQRIVVVPALDLGIVLTGGDYDSAAPIAGPAGWVQRVVDTVIE